MYRLQRTLQLVGGTDPDTALPAGAAGLVTASWASSVTVVMAAGRCARQHRLLALLLSNHQLVLQYADSTQGHRIERHIPWPADAPQNVAAMW